MFVWYQMFIIVVIIYHTCAIVSGTSDNCNCDVLQINGDLIGNQSFLKQNDNINGKPYYFSSRWNLISWKHTYWSYEKYDSSMETFVTTAIYDPKFFSFENECKNWYGEKHRKGNSMNSIFVQSQCLRDNRIVMLQLT